MVVEFEKPEADAGNIAAGDKSKGKGKRKKGKKRQRDEPAPKGPPTGKKVRLKNVPPPDLSVAQLFDWHHLQQAPELTKLERTACGELTTEHFNNDVGDVYSLVEFLKQTPKKKLKCLVITRSARRCCELIKTGFGPARVPVVKLFAKHLKIKEQQEAIANADSSVGIGTPNRIMKLMEVGALSADTFETIVLDLGPDSKGFTLLTTPIVGADLFKLYRTYLSKQVVAEGSNTKIMLIEENKEKDN